MTRHTTGCSDSPEIRRKYGKLGKDHDGKTIVVLSEDAALRDETSCFLAGEAFALGAYCFNRNALKVLKPGDEYAKRDRLSLSKNIGPELIEGDEWQKRAFIGGITFGKYVNYARTLGNLPANVFGTEEMVGYIRSVFEGTDVGVQILRDRELKEMSCGGILSVNRGSEKEAAVAILRYKSAPERPLTALVGKGVMFDTGGHHLKDMSSMFGMKYDMCGAATILELVEYMAAARKKANIVAILPIVENSIGPCASRPGDVITTLSGLSVEIMNTDAEGRLILCDALSLAAKEGAKSIIDLATLTNSAREALGDDVVGVFSNDDGAYECFEKSSMSFGERIWRLPLGEPYSDWVRKSTFADLINYAPGKGAGASFAASFLEAFVPEDITWIHLDYVGPSVQNEEREHLGAGATGAMAASILGYLEDSFS